MKRVCVYCGSSLGKQAEYIGSARELAKGLTERGIGLVYGGASVGIMGEIADAVLSDGGEVIGVIPQALADKEVAHNGLTELKVVDSMHERKAIMADLADGFIALPGGLGTLEELFEVLTWSQLGLHQKPIGLLNVKAYYEKLRSFLDHAVEEQFVKTSHRALLLVEENPEELLALMENYQPPIINQWISRDNT